MKEYVVPCTIAEERHIVVMAKTPEEAREKVARGKYKRLGRPLTRGFLLIGTPEAKP